MLFVLLFTTFLQTPYSTHHVQYIHYAIMFISLDLYHFCCIACKAISRNELSTAVRIKFIIANKL